MNEKVFISPKELAKEIWGVFGYREKNAIYRYLKNGVFAPIEEKTGFKILKDGNRFLIPNGLAKAIKEQRGK